MEKNNKNNKSVGKQQGKREEKFVKYIRQFMQAMLKYGIIKWIVVQKSQKKDGLQRLIRLFLVQKTS
mgnify:CR=1 FL=1